MTDGEKLVADVTARLNDFIDRELQRVEDPRAVVLALLVKGRTLMTDVDGSTSTADYFRSVADQIGPVHEPEVRGG